MKLRGSADGEIPVSLLHFRQEDWSDDPHAASIAWAKARRMWGKMHCRTIEELNRLYAPDVVFPPRSDPRVDRDLALALHPTLRVHREERWQQ